MTYLLDSDKCCQAIPVCTEQYLMVSELQKSEQAVACSGPWVRGPSLTGTSFLSVLLNCGTALGVGDFLFCFVFYRCILLQAILKLLRICLEKAKNKYFQGSCFLGKNEKK